MTWTESCAYMDRLIASDAPPFLKAHYFMRVLLPKLVAQLGIEACAVHLSHLVMDALCAQSGTCCVCRGKPSDGGARGDGMCCKCRAEMDQVIADAGLELNEGQ